MRPILRLERGLAARKLLSLTRKRVTSCLITIRSEPIQTPSRHCRDRILIKQTRETNQKETSMNEEAFRQYYAQWRGDELARVLANKQDLVQEAVGVLDQEVQRRQVIMPAPPQWTRHPDSDERGGALALQLNRYWSHISPYASRYFNFCVQLHSNAARCRGF
jgi:hypothetical protein